MSTIPMEYRPKDTGRTTNILLANNHLAIAQVAKLRFSPFGGQSVEGEDQAGVLAEGRFQPLRLLSFVAGQERQVDLLIEMAHVRERDLYQQEIGRAHV